MLREPRILIIGAGAAGISAACRLYERGLKNIIILEAKNRIGGRIFTTEFADNVVDLGAQWVHGETDNIVYNLVKSQKILDSSHRLNDTNKHIFVDSTGEFLPKSEASVIWQLYYSITDIEENVLKQQNGSYGDYFIKKFYEYFNETHFTNETRAAQILEWMGKFDNSLQCCDTWFDVSAKGLAEYRSCDGDHVLNWKDRGYKTLFDILMVREDGVKWTQEENRGRVSFGTLYCEEYAKSMKMLKHKYPDASKSLPILPKIKFSTEVKSIDYTNPNEITVSSSAGEEYKADNVIFTASLGVLKSEYSSLFIPKLPVKKELAIKGLNIGTVDKIFLEFPQRWWPEEAADFEFLWTEEEKNKFIKDNPEDHWLLDVFGFFTVDYQPRILCGWITSRGARVMETLSETVIKEKIFWLLEKFLGKTYNIPWPDRILTSKWYTDKHFRGCYTYRSLDSERMNVWSSDLADPILSGESNKPTILFAGEATHDHYYSTVHGAVETGFREAERLVEYYGQVDRSSIGPINIESVKIGEIEVEKTRIAIVGGGIAGLSAAKALEDQKFYDYILLEAQDYFGGRIKSVRWNDNWIEEGAQFLHGDESELAKFCSNHNLISDEESTEGDGIYIRNDGLQFDKKFIDEIDDLIKNTLEDCEKYIDYVDEKQEEIPDSIGSLLRRTMSKHLASRNDINIKKLKEEIFDWHKRFLIIDNSCSSLDNLSAKYWGQFRFVGGPEHLVLKDGYSSAVEVISQSLRQLNLRLNSPVRRIEWSADVPDYAPVIITDEKKIIADCVLVTSSLGFLKKHHEKMFEPSLPVNLTLAINSLGFGLINKVFLDFGKPWWKPGVKGFQLIWHDNNESPEIDVKLAVWTRDLTGFDVLQDHEAVLLGWVGGRGAEVIESLSEEEVGNDCIDLLRFFMKRENLPGPKRCKRSQWGRNEWVAGSYSNISTKCDDNGSTTKSLSAPVWGRVHKNHQLKNVPVIMLAGEATHDCFYSTTHGAYDSGRAQAMKFLEYHVHQ